jgi:hypothetical protein
LSVDFFFRQESREAAEQVEKVEKSDRLIYPTVNWVSSYRVARYAPVSSAQHIYRRRFRLAFQSGAP